jgi:integrase
MVETNPPSEGNQGSHEGDMSGEVIPMFGTVTAKSIPIKIRCESKYWKSLGRNLILHKKTGYIYVRKKFKRLGIPELFASTGERGKVKAATRAEVLITQWKNKYLGIDDSKVISRPVTKTVSSIIDEILLKYTPTQASETQAQHKLYLGKIREKFGDFDINSITEDSFNCWIAEERIRTKCKRAGCPDRNSKCARPEHQERARLTFSDYSKHMNLLFTKAYNWKFATHMIRFSDPDKIHKKVLEQKVSSELSEDDQDFLELKQGRVYTKAERDELWKHMNETTRDQFSICFGCIMRLREVLNAPWSEIDLVNGIWALPAARVKTRQSRTFVIEAKALERLRARYESRDNDSPFVFPSRFDPRKPCDSNDDAWRRAKKNAGIEGRARWHDIRHTALTIAVLGDPELPPGERIKQRKPIGMVSLYAGVSEKVLKDVYLHTDAQATAEVAGAVSIF